MTSSRLVGTIIENKYSLDEQIGHGGMGAVFRATQLMVDRTVAIKLLHSQLASHDNFKARFEVEAKAIGRMNHPNCITLFDFGYSQNLEAFYTVVEFIHGRSLESLLKTNPDLTTVVGIIRQIASGLDHAHHHGILHRDLKPENIMLAQMTDGSEMVKVLDFGIAQIVKGSADSPQSDTSDLYPPMEDDFDADRITRVGEVFGTPPYMSPEQARSTRNLTPACDLYSLGVIFYELVAGRLPFFSDNPLDILLMHINEPPPPIERLQALPELHAIIMGLLAKDPAQRIQSGQELISKLDAISPEFLERESSAIPLKSQPSGNKRRVINQAPTGSWVETCDTDDQAQNIPNFQPPPQAQRQISAKPGPGAGKSTTAASTKAEKQPDRQSTAFQTMITFDEIEAQAASQQATRWGMLVFVTALSALIIFFMFKYEKELAEKLPFTSTVIQSVLQTMPDQPQSATNSAAADNLPDTEISEYAESDAGDEKISELQPDIPAPIPARAAPVETKPDFPAPTRPATQKRQAKKSTSKRKKTRETTPSKPAKIERDDRSNPPSKGPRILEF